MRSIAETATPLWLRVILLVIPCVVFFVQNVTAVAGSAHDVLPILEHMEASYARINDYQAVLYKQERVKGNLRPEEKILLKFQKPLKVYMKWIGEPLKGTEALYVQGKYDDKIICHRGGVLGVVTLSLDPRGSIAMKGNRHPITQVGFGFIIEELRRNLHEALPHGECEIIRIGDEVFKGRPATGIEARFTPREGRKYYASRAVIHIDKEFLLPVGSAFYDEKDVAFEKYSYSDVKFNAGLTEKDFSRYNEQYRF